LPGSRHLPERKIGLIQKPKSGLRKNGESHEIKEELLKVIPIVANGDGEVKKEAEKLRS
jgi:hypothetical protein